MTRRCKQCKEVELRPVAKCQSIIEKKGYCSVECLADHTAQKRIASERKAAAKKHREDKERVKTRQQWQKEAQQAFNAWIRERDKLEPCISCGRHHEGQYHAGHYRTTAAAPQLRFNPENCHKQCAPCNNHLSGNIANYRPALINKIGLVKVEAIENNSDLKSWSIEDLQEIKTKYKLKLKQLKLTSS